MDWGWQLGGLAATLLISGGLFWTYRAAQNRAEAVVFGLLLALIVAVVLTRGLPDAVRRALAQGVALGLSLVVAAGTVAVHRRSAAGRRARNDPSDSAPGE